MTDQQITIILILLVIFALGAATVIYSIWKLSKIGRGLKDLAEKLAKLDKASGPGRR